MHRDAQDSVFPTTQLPLSEALISQCAQSTITRAGGAAGEGRGGAAVRDKRRLKGPYAHFLDE